MLAPKDQWVDTRTLIWNAMNEADTYRRYYIKLCDRLRLTNLRFLLAAWGLGGAGAILSVIPEVHPGAGIAAVIAAAAVTSLRDVLRLPDRIAECRAVVITTNDEYDDMRMLWETGGAHREATEIQSFRRVSRASYLVNETVDRKLFAEAEAASAEFHTDMESPDHAEILIPTTN